MPSAEIDRLVRIDLAPQGAEATLRLDAGIADSDLIEHVVFAAIAGKVEVTEPVQQAVRGAIKAYPASRATGLSVVIARATQPVHGVDGRIEFDPGMDPRRDDQAGTTPAAASGAKVDHHDRSRLHIVHAGQRVGRVIAPVRGVDGRDVTGRTLAAKDGREVPLRLDETVQRHPDGTLTVAADGALEFQPPVLRVRTTLEISGWVDFSTGNVDFSGDVTVSGGVRDCFLVRTGRSLTVHGVVEAANIAAGRDATLMGGMAARERGVLCVERDLSAKYLDNVRVDVGRDMAVEKEIINCHASVGRQFVSESCSVTGGVLVVGHRCSVARLGNPAGTPTVVVLGRLDAVEQLADQAHELLPLVEGRAARYKERLGTLHGATGKLSPHQAEELTELEFIAADAEDKAKALVAGLDKIRRVVGSHAAVDLTVRSRLCSGVTLYAGPWVAELQNDIKGPVRVHLSGGELVATDLGRDATVPLVTLAKVRRHERYKGPVLASIDPASLKSAC